MDTVEQLWLLKQIYQNENSYYDREKNVRLYHIPAGIMMSRICKTEFKMSRSR